jgi:hypothetical protein
VSAEPATSLTDHFEALEGQVAEALHVVKQCRDKAVGVGPPPPPKPDDDDITTPSLPQRAERLAAELVDLVRILKQVEAAL